ncbi:hypothetical protein BO70DRAFT_426541 [Aspergillus heteromorphus CBS 117.55]|uniref:Uncharacterized protein n=1 Tax=Aspergillus heteromorphus CBS 117.55 TaxID=1448321 RepID=A0A317WZK1_9EURO|nr:uncharacterized protein BO70DRAFT_426541 [Aspergillus heteromorphus CBS 117.55]PWY90158.1 hypothetical protein BO70DRAFT_426541 [Aspergillus heteromorphus CBS 117.55]
MKSGQLDQPSQSMDSPSRKTDGFASRTTTSMESNRHDECQSTEAIESLSSKADSDFHQQLTDSEKLDQGPLAEILDLPTTAFVSITKSSKKSEKHDEYPPTKAMEPIDSEPDSSSLNLLLKDCEDSDQSLLAESVDSSISNTTASTSLTYLQDHGISLVEYGEQLDVRLGYPAMVNTIEWAVPDEQLSLASKTVAENELFPLEGYSAQLASIVGEWETTGFIHSVLDGNRLSPRIRLYPLSFVGLKLQDSYEATLCFGSQLKAWVPKPENEYNESSNTHYGSGAYRPIKIVKKQPPARVELATSSLEGWHATIASRGPHTAEQKSEALTLPM